MSWQIERATSIAEVDPTKWDALTEGAVFASHAWLSALETFGPALPSEGWSPNHILVRDGQGRLCGAVPLYVKTNSLYETGSDAAWRMAHERAVGPYYPKLQSEVPAHTLVGNRLLVGSDVGAAERRSVLIDAVLAVAEAEHMPSLHFSFIERTEWEMLAARGFLCDYGIRFVWQNRGYETFDDFLAPARYKARGRIRTERRRAKNQGLRFEFLEGEAITPDFVESFLPLYRATYEKYETPLATPSDTIRRICSTKKDTLLFLTAFDGDRLVAASMNAREPGALVGMHWGASVQLPYILFEFLYMSIDYAIAHGIDRVDAGPGGNHKSSRGFWPEPSYAAHWFRDASFAEMLRPGVERSRHAVDEQMSELAAVHPFSRSRESEE